MMLSTLNYSKDIVPRKTEIHGMAKCSETCVDNAFRHRTAEMHRQGKKIPKGGLFPA